MWELLTIKWELMVRESFFHGQRDYRVDAKGRVPFPANWLDQMKIRFGENLIVAKGMSQDERYLEIFSPDAWSKQVDRILAKLPEGKMKQSFIRWYVSTAESIELDGQKRVRLPKSLMEWAGVKKDISLLGSLETIQLWAQEVMSESDEFNPNDLGAIFDLFNTDKPSQESD